MGRYQARPDAAVYLSGVLLRGEEALQHWLVRMLEIKVITQEEADTVTGWPGAITVDLTTLQSDEDRRDRYLRTRSLQSDTFSTAEFVLQETPGLPWPLPAEGEAIFQMVGEMTLHGVTHPLTWDATAQFNDNSVSGKARTSFTFEEFDMDVPSVSVVLSVENNIRLEIDFAGSISRE
jgi:polyisoprenoid-binding protein YceI